MLTAPFLSAPLWIADQRAYLAAMPAEVRQVVAKGDYESPAYQEAVMAFYRKHLCLLDPWPEPVQRTFAKMGDAVYLSMFGPSEFTATGSLKDADLVGRLGEITVPVLFTCGSQDEATPATARLYQRALPGAELAVFADTAHQHHLEKPDEYLPAVRGFLARTEGRG